MARIQVREGETLRQIIQRLGIAPEALFQLNPGIERGLVAGMFLTVPDAQAPMGVERGATPLIEERLTTDVNEAIKYILGRGLPLEEAGALMNLAPELRSMFEGRVFNLENTLKSLGIQGDLSQFLPRAIDVIQQSLPNLRALTQRLGGAQRSTFAGIPSLTSRRLRF